MISRGELLRAMSIGAAVALGVGAVSVTVYAMGHYGFAYTQTASQVSAQTVLCLAGVAAVWAVMVRRSDDYSPCRNVVAVAVLATVFLVVSLMAIIPVTAHFNTGPVPVVGGGGGAPGV